MVRGEIKVLNGVIRVPEKEKDLLPASGESMLWESEAWAPGAADSVDRELVAARSDTARAGYRMDVDVRVLPGNLWMRGRQMEIELEGEYLISRRFKLNTIHGANSSDVEIRWGLDY